VGRLGKSLLATTVGRVSCVLLYFFMLCSVVGGMENIALAVLGSPGYLCLCLRTTIDASDMNDIDREWTRELIGGNCLDV
jgi:hypothetical protein